MFNKKCKELKKKREEREGINKKEDHTTPNTC